MKAKVTRNKQPEPAKRAGTSDVRVKVTGRAGRLQWLTVRGEDLIGFTYIDDLVKAEPVKAGTYEVQEQQSPVGNDRKVFLLVGREPVVYINCLYLERIDQDRFQLTDRDPLAIAA